jgi:glycosyltransferase involved in cell wall biosynthesis
MTEPEISLALPCYNESGGVASVIKASAAALSAISSSWEILVVDNCSSDGTPDVVRGCTDDPRVRLEVHEKNRFYAGSCQTALEKCRGQYVAIMDSDGQFSAGDLPVFLEQLRGGANLVFGWRQVRHDPFSRKVGSAVFNAMAWALLGFPFHDLNVGLRMFDRKVVHAANPLRHRLNMANPELWVRARRAGLKVVEVPVSHAPRLAGESCHDMRKSTEIFMMVLRHFLDLRRD